MEAWRPSAEELLKDTLNPRYKPVANQNPQGQNSFALLKPSKQPSMRILSSECASKELWTASLKEAFFMTNHHLRYFTQSITLLSQHLNSTMRASLEYPFMPFSLTFWIPDLDRHSSQILLLTSTSNKSMMTIKLCSVLQFLWSTWMKNSQADGSANKPRPMLNTRIIMFRKINLTGDLRAGMIGLLEPLDHRPGQLILDLMLLFRAQTHIPLYSLKVQRVLIQQPMSREKIISGWKTISTHSMTCSDPERWILRS